MILRRRVWTDKSNKAKGCEASAATPLFYSPESSPRKTRTNSGEHTRVISRERSSGDACGHESSRRAQIHCSNQVRPPSATRNLRLGGLLPGSETPQRRPAARIRRAASSAGVDRASPARITRAATKSPRPEPTRPFALAKWKTNTGRMLGRIRSFRRDASDYVTR